MGWTFTYSHKTKKQEVDYLLSPYCRNAGATVLAHSLRGNTLYSVVENADGSRYIAVDLIQYSRADQCYGHKDLSESMGPCEVNCPLSFLDMVPEPEHNYGWRDKVRAYHAARTAKAKRTFAPGQRITLGGQGFTLTAPRTTSTGRAAGWYATGDDGTRYRVSAAHMGRAVHV